MYLTQTSGQAIAASNLTIPTEARRRARAADLGLNPIAIGCICAVILVLLITVPVGMALGLGLEFGRIGWLRVGWGGTLLLAWGYFFVFPGKPREWIVPEVISALLLQLLLGMVLVPAQYVAAALNRPLVDAWLAAADSALGIHVPSLAAWTWQHPAVNLLLVYAYNSFPLQLLTLIVVLGALRDRQALWEFMFVGHACVIVTVLCSAAFPVACAFAYFGFDSTLDFTRFTAHFNGMRNGTMTVIPYSNMDGLISMPSFHAAGGMMLIWALRRHRVLLVVSAAWNTLLIASTVMSGAHYVVDVIAAAVLVALCIWVYQTKLRHFHP